MLAWGGSVWHVGRALRFFFSVSWRVGDVIFTSEWEVVVVERADEPSPKRQSVEACEVRLG